LGFIFSRTNEKTEKSRHSVYSWQQWLLPVTPVTQNVSHYPIVNFLRGAHQYRSPPQQSFPFLSFSAHLY